MLAELRKVRFPVETGLLLAFCLFLPLLEFWKNFALLAFLFAWVVNRLRARDFGGPWRTSDSVALLWIVAAYLAAAFAGLDGRAWAKTGDVAASALLFWMVARAGYAEREQRWLLVTLVLSTLAGLAIGYWRLWSGEGKSGNLQLYSVGHVNHTAIYIAIMLGVCASGLFAGWRSWPAARRGLALAASALVFASLVVTASRAAVGIGLALVLALSLAWWPRWRAPLAASLAVVALTAAALYGFGAEVVRKQMENAAAQNVLSFRDGVWRTGLAGWQKYPWFGVGKDNYGLITQERVRAWRTEAGEPYDAAEYFPSSHGHSLYFTTLAERGLVGFAALAAVLLASLAALVRWRPRPGDADLACVLWGGAASAWFVTAGVGAVNTTLHHEHGLLAALLFGLWLSTLRRRPGSA
ncbi:MAG TPA: O-antigen ligase family protein [Burkholderiales bacterium]